MSGFVAVLGAPREALLREWTSRLAYRGPDGQSVRVEGRLGLGVAQLGDAPGPLSLDGRTWLAGDVRLDARAELRRDLPGVPPDAPDAELVLRAFREWGDRCVDRLSGDFAFVICDGERLFAARDQVGTVPLHFARTEHGLVLSNSIEALPRAGALNERAIGDYLLFGYNADPASTFFAGVSRLPPAHVLTLDGSRRYWSPPPIEEPWRDRDCVGRFRAALDAAVADRVRGGPVATTLSGGMDSTAIAALAAPHVELRAYTAGLDGLMEDAERPFAELAARHLGIPLTRIDATEWFLDAGSAWRDVPEPRFEARRAPGALMAERALADGHRVLLAGFGGDGALAPPRRRWSELIEHRRYGRLAADYVRFRRRFGRPPGLRGSRRRAARLDQAPPLLVPLNPEFARALDLPARHREVHEARLRTDPRLAMAVDPFWSELLAGLDPGSTRLPLRIRNPFFDLRVLREVLRVPPVPWLFGKALLRAALADRLPAEIVGRPKATIAGNQFHAAAVGGHEPWLEELAGAAELAPYLDLERLRERVRSLTTLPPQEYGPVILTPASLVRWLQTTRR